MSRAINKETENQRAALVFSCVDQVGIIARLTSFFAERDLNISRYEEFTDDGYFFSRLEWSLNELWEDEQAFSNEFQQLADSYNADFDIRFFNRPASVGLFVSTQPHALIGILNKYEADYFPHMEVSFIVADDKAMHAIADRHGIPFFYVSTEVEALDYEHQQLEIVHRYNPDILGLARYGKVVSTNFLQQVSCPIVNIHDSFPASCNGAEPYQMAYDSGIKLIGATARLVTPELDHGPIIEQEVKRVPTAVSLPELIKLGCDIEQKVFARAMLKMLDQKIIVHGNRTIVFH
ncbi:MAG: formyltetrahydrofolate deformylase [Arenicella sp.]|nr:formyltetrahydrofolate deformylase [Arenicella sp.]